MARRWRVLLIGGLEPSAQCYAPLAAVAELVPVEATQQAVAAHIAEADACLTGLAVRFDRAMLNLAPRLRAIAFPATGHDHVDLAAAAERGIAVMSLQEAPDLLRDITATAEMAWCLLLATVRKLPWAFQAAKAGLYPGGGGLLGHMLSGKTLGVLGYGRLGRMVGQYGLAFRMRVLACNRRPVPVEPGVTLVDHDRLYAQSDVLSIHIHLEGNERLLDRRAFARLKEGAVLINTSRGGLLDEQALLEALASGRLAGAGLDVIDGEWQAELVDVHPLIRYARDHDNLVLTPHIAGATVESQQITRDFIIRRLAEFLKT